MPASMQARKWACLIKARSTADENVSLSYKYGLADSALLRSNLTFMQFGLNDIDHNRPLHACLHMTRSDCVDDSENASTLHGEIIGLLALN